MAKKPKVKRSTPTSSNIPTSSEASLEQLGETTEHIEAIQDCLEEFIDTLDDNQSAFSQTANTWGPLPLWQKAFGGVLLFGVLITIGVIAHLALMVAIVSTCACVYVIAGLSLDNHYAIDKKNKQYLNKLMRNLTDMFGHMVDALDNIRKQLATEIDRLKLDIDKLDKSVLTLHEEIDSFQEKIEQMAEQTEMLAITREDLDITRQELERLKETLTDQVTEFAILQQQLETEVNEVTANNATLRASVDTLSACVIDDEEARSAFLNRLDECLNDAKSNFHHVVTRICKAEQELVKVKRQLKSYIKQFKGQVDRNEKQVRDLTKATTTLTQFQGQKQHRIKMGAFFHHRTAQNSTPSKHTPINRSAILVKYGFIPQKATAQTSFLHPSPTSSTSYVKN